MVKLFNFVKKEDGAAVTVVAEKINYVSDKADLEGKKFATIALDGGEFLDVTATYDCVVEMLKKKTCK